MLHQILALFHETPGTTLSLAAIAARLEVSPGLLEHMLRTLVRSGRLVEVADCADCGDCTLRRICVGGLGLRQQGYALADGVVHR